MNYFYHFIILTLNNKDTLAEFSKEDMGQNSILCFAFKS